MGKYLTPLWTFIGGQMLALILFLLLPNIGAAGDTLAAHSHISTFWGMSWAAGSLRLIVVVMVELLTLFVTWVAILKAKA